MKLLNTIIQTLSLGCVLVLYSCDSFLEETSQDEIIPSTLEDLSATMYAEAYPYLINTDVYLNLLTDEIECNGLTDDGYVSQYQNGTAIFKYDPAMFDGAYSIPDDANSWKTYYEKIKGCNVVLDYLPQVTGSDVQKNAVKGQALFLRGFYYLRLALIYCDSYSADGVDPEQALGVPLVLSMDILDEFPVRASLKDTYAQIERDLTDAVELLKANYDAPSEHRISYLADEAMLSRLYLYMGRDEDWQKVIDFSDDVLAGRPMLTMLSSFESSFHSKGIYDLDVSSEPLWVYGVSSLHSRVYFPTDVYQTIIPYSVSGTLTGLYDANDLRRTSWFYPLNSEEASYSARSNKIGLSQYNYGDWGIRNAEVYLNRAEAYARLYKSDGNPEYCANALADLNYLRQSRYVPGTYEPVDFDHADQLIDFCLEERRRELSLENGLRWFDIKRLNLSVTHTYIDDAGAESTYTLKAGDPLYALPIPFDAIDRNYRLVQNPR